MTDTIEYYFATPSPWAYFATPRIKSIGEKYNVKIKWKPCDLSKIFSINGTAQVKDRPKPVQLNRLKELERWANFLNMPNAINPKFSPVDPTLSHKIIILSELNNYDPCDITFAFMKSVWVDEIDIADEETIKTLCKENNIIIEDLIYKANSKEINSLYEKNTDEALKNNVWGSPTFIYKNELFWGQDRIDFLERAIQDHN